MTFEMNYESIDFFIDEEFEPLYDLFENNSIKKVFENPIDRINYLYEKLEHIELVKAKMEYLCSHFSFFATTYNKWNYEDFTNMLSELTEMVRYLTSDIKIFEAEKGERYFKPAPLSLDKVTKKINIDTKTVPEDENKRAVIELILKNMRPHFFSKCTNETVGHAVHFLTNRKFSATLSGQHISNREYKREIYLETIAGLKDIIKQLEIDIPKEL